VTADAVERAIAELAAWAETEPRIAGVAIVGSHARGAARPDSDVDVVVLSETPDAFFADTSWLSRFGRIARTVEERWGRVRTWRVWLADGGELELGFTTPDWASVPLDPGTRRVVEDGIRLVFDRTGAFRAR
jgi:predicted nucleotidyltransferase